MAPRSEKSRTPAKPVLPLDVYASLVDSLYAQGMVLFTGALASSLAALLTAWKSMDGWLFGFAVAMAVVACIRAWDMRHYGRIRATVTRAETLKDWELRYVIGAALHVALLGGWTLAAFIRTDDPFVHLFSFSTTLAYMIGIAGRNFASDSLVSAQIVCAAVPLSAALFFAGGFYYAVFGLVILPFFASLRIISRRLRKVLLDAVITARDISKLAVQFDTALNNMPHGLVMFDGDRRLVVANRKFQEFFSLADVGDLTGTTPAALVHHWVAAGVVLRSEADRLATALEDRLAGRDRDGFTLQKQDGRTLEFDFEAMAKGGSVAVIEDVTDQRAAEARINHLARFDALTGLANRVYFRERVERLLAAAAGEACAILFIDLDQFKQVNDTLGHPRGDTLLRAVAERLRRLVRETDIVARFGGDEFVVLQTPINSVDDAASLATRIIAALAEPYEVDGHQVVIGASIGIALYPRDAASVDQLLKIADMALYWAKADQRGTWRFFEPEMDVRAHARRSLELDLRHALATNAFEVHYQPLFDIRTKQISTCEALLRWPHPTRDWIPPSEFIPVAEEMGLIVELGSWVLREACRACATWPNNVRVAVNLSTHQFRRGDVVQVIREAVEGAGLAPDRLEIEITESVLFQDTRAMRQILRRLNDFGVRISLDDFGTGYSSLSYLHSLPLDKVKIDRSFLEGLESSARPLVLLRGITKLSAELGLSVTVEGIETPEQLALIAAEPSVTEAQGFLFSPAVPEREIRTMLLAQPSRMELVA